MRGNNSPLCFRQTASLMKQSSSLPELVITHMDPVACVPPGNICWCTIFLRSGARQRGVALETCFIHPACHSFGFCLMFLQKTGMCVCLVAILVRLSTFPPLTRPSSLYPSLSFSLSLSALILPCLCMCV